MSVTDNAYLQHMRLLSEHYRDRITLLCGIEVATCDVKGVRLPKEIDISGFDYCLIEHIDTPTTEVDDLFAFRKRCGTPRAGIAHTDLFSYFAQKGFDPLAFFTRMAEEKIFWEMNVNYDSIHAYREHAYVIDFFADEEKQKIVKQSGVEISVGFDGHRLKDYAPDRVKNACKRLEELGIPMPFASLAKKNGD